jgi:hypothetical protein
MVERVMKEGYRACEGSEFLAFLEERVSEEDGPFSMSLLGWQDGQYFKELCEEDGGAVPEHIAFYRALPLGLRLNSKGDLVRRVSEAVEKPYLTSRNGNVRFHYDIHIWTKRCYFVYNTFVRQLWTGKRNLLSRLLSPVRKPAWQTG